METDSYPKRLVLIGGGFGNIQLIKRLKNYSSFQITLIDKHNYHTFQPLLYQVASGGLGSDAVAYPYRKIFRNYKNFNFRLAEVQEIDAEKNMLLTNIGPIGYDELVIGTGSETNFYGMENMAKWAMELKSIPQALDLRSNILQEFEEAINTVNMGERKAYLNFVVVGAGPTGVETAGALAEFKKHVLPFDYPELDHNLMQVHLVEAGSRLMPAMSEIASTKTKEYLEELGVKVWLNTAVKDFDGKAITFGDGTALETRTVLWSAGVKGSLISGIKEEAILRKSRYLVDETNKVKGYDNIYAIGDVAAMVTDKTPNGHPGVAQVAIQQGERLGKNMIARMLGRKQKPFQYNDLGSMATIGRNRAVVDLPFIKFQGRIAWLAWMFIHLMTLVSFRNRVIVFVNWMWNYFTYERSIRLIIRPFTTKTKD
jgi:NADH dehydrogenase